MSVHKSIADAVKTAIEGLTGEPPVTVRAHSWYVEGDPIPLLIVTMLGERGTPNHPEGESREYEILVTAIYSQEFLLTTGIDDGRAWRETIRKRLIPDPTVAVGSILSGVSSVWNVDAVDLPIESEGLFSAGYEESRLGLVYYTSEVSHA